MRFTIKRRIQRVARYAATVLVIAAIAAYRSDLGELLFKAVVGPCIAIILFWLAVKFQPRDPGPRSPRPEFCPECGYDLRATPDRCPECGREETDYERFARNPAQKP